MVREALASAAGSLAAVSDSPRLDAELLMAHALGGDRNAVLLHRLDEAAPPGFDALVERRRSQEPLAYITGHREFWSLDLKVGPGVLIPRPDSETLIETALRALAGRPPAVILDLGTGSGALLLAALSEWPQAHGVGIDRSDHALSYARDNANRLGLSERAVFRNADWGAGEKDRYDLVLCNPPYVESGAELMADVSDFEPEGALYAGEDGLTEYRTVVPQLSGLLSNTGVACVEIGAGQAKAVADICTAHGLVSEVSQDLAGQDRCLLIHR